MRGAWRRLCCRPIPAASITRIGARTDCRRVIKKTPTSYLKKLYFDTIVFTHHQLEYLAELYGSDHIMLGTDYPYDMALPNAVRFVESGEARRARPRPRSSAAMPRGC